MPQERRFIALGPEHGRRAGGRIIVATNPDVVHPDLGHPDAHRVTSGYAGYVLSLHLLELAGIKPPGEPLAAVAPLRSGPFTGLCPEGV